jgi:serine/threonine-protein kinase SRPK3
VFEKPKLQTKLVEHNLIDRSYTDLGYIGYGDGIQLMDLDSTGNWQFG